MIEFRHDYQFRNCNWYGFTFIHFYFERDMHDNSLNLELGLMGLNLHISYALPWDTKQSNKLRKEIEKIAKQLSKENNERTKAVSKSKTMRNRN